MNDATTSSSYQPSMKISDADYLIIQGYIDAIQQANTEATRNTEALRSHMKALNKAQTTPAQNIPPQTRNPPDLSHLPWRVKGGGNATERDGFAYCFASNREGQVYPNLLSIVNYIAANSGEVHEGQWLIKLSPDKKFLNRMRA